MTKKIILASASPRRKEILSKYVKDFEVIVSNIDETFNKNLPVDEVVINIAKSKCLDVYSKVNKNSIIISADTIVCYNNKIYGKPASKNDAIKTLKELRGQTHSVITAVYCIDTDSNRHCYFTDETLVTFYNFDDNIIEKYINTNEYIDKAGSYAIQGYGSILVEKINGNYDNVVGLPISKLIYKLRDIGITLF